MADALASGTFRFDLVSPEKVLFSVDAAMVTIPGELGEFGVLPGHAPLLSSLRPGVVAVTLPSGEVQKVFVAGGFADVSGDFCSVLAEEAEPLSALDRTSLEIALAALKAESAPQERVRVVEAKLEALKA